MSRRISRLCGQDVPDTQCGYRMVQRTLVPHLLTGTSRFEYETEMLIIASRQGFRIAPVPISTIYSDEVSSIHPVRDTIRFFKLIRRYEKGMQAGPGTSVMGMQVRAKILKIDVESSGPQARLRSRIRPFPPCLSPAS
jgi:hypothetical protein